MRHFSARTLAALLCAALALGPITQSAYAQTALADVPIAAKVAAKPNIVYTVDDSGSMANNYIPDYVASGTYPSFCRGGIQVDGLGRPYYLTSGGFNITQRNCGPGSLTAFNFPGFYVGDFNHLAYDPDVTYQPPLKADGTPLTFNVGIVTDKFGNQIDLKQVQSDPYLSAATTVDLSVNVSVPLFCNTDWPIITNPPAVGEVGNAAGEYIAGAGAYCRINGTAYDANANGAPAVSNDYNYPWPKVGAAAGAVGVPNAAAYFWRQNSQRQIWCNTGAADWPQTCNGAWQCTMGGTYTAPLPQAQTCYLQNTSMVCTSAPNVYTPAGCNTDPAYDLGGCVAGQEQTCLTCVKTNPCVTWTQQSNGACHLTANGGPPGSGGSGAACTCLGVGCVLPACAAFTPNPTNANCSKGVLKQKCNPNAGACTDKAFNPATLTNRAYTLLDDSNMVNGGTGTICRHNNFDYATGLPKNAPAGYPTAPWVTPITSGCPTDIPTTLSIPRHYYTVSSIQFCDKADGTANAQWNGFGTGVCQSKNDFTKYKFVKWGNFTRTDLIPSSAPFPYTDITGLANTRTYVEEAINYGNWYAYYRTRILAAKSVSSIAFSFLDDTYRVGFHDLGTVAATAPPIWVDVDDFKGTAAGTTRGDWYNALFNIKINNYSTFTMSAMLRIGNLFQNGKSAGLPATVNPLPAGAKDPITLSCQNNYHILITDGFTNEPTLQTVVGEQDAVVPNFTSPDILPDQVLPNLRPKKGKPWPEPFVQETKAVADTLSDIATYYWATDLRPGMKDDVPSSSGKGTGDLDPTKDVAWWQHVSFSAISFGSEGVLDASQRKATIAAITAKTQFWPDLTNPNSPVNPAANKGAAGVDDLWHATVNSRGQFVYAKSPIEVSYGLASILAGIQNQRKSRVGASFSGTVLDATNNIIYEATIEPGWAGDLLKVQIDPTTAKETGTLWQASAVLAAQIAQYISAAATPTVPASNGLEPWFTNRRIVTINDKTGKVVPFTYPSLSATQLATLGSKAQIQKEVIAYLRGASVYDTGVANPTPPPPTIYKPIEGTGIGQFRQRFGALGDISNGQPVIVTAANSPFRDANDPGYSGYVGGAAGARPTRIVAPANDGIVHVIDSNDGHEVMGFIPKAIIRSDVDASGRPNGIQALTFQDGGVPIYKHHFYVDSSPRTSDVDFNSAGVFGGGDDWHTIVVGGLGKGGNSYYALDLTDPDAADETVAAAKVLWEVTDGDWVYTYGRPIIVKTYAYGWSVIVTSGYNNVSGEGRIYFLDPKTGNQQRKYLTTGTTCPGGAPAGLAQINGFTKDFHNQFVEQVYGGDLCGNLWRFDLTDPKGAYPAPVLFATLDDGAKAQPITTAPQIEIDFSNGVDRYVFIGTGQLLDPSDLQNPLPAQQQTMYAIRDGSLSTPLVAGLPVTRGNLVPINPDLVSAVVGGAPNGWFHDLPTGVNAERIVTDVEADVNTVTYVGTQAQTDPCIIALPANVYAREYTTGRSLLADAGGNPIPAFYSAAGGVGMQVVGMTDPSTGAITLGGLLSLEIPGTSPIRFVPPNIVGNNRFGFRLLPGQ
jgi:type IV pilus assembly protein PilY1